MEKEINIKIIGTLTPEVGVAEQYTVKKENEPFEIQPITLGSDWNDSEIKWFVHVRDAGKWRFIDDGKKIGKIVDFTFSEISQDWEEIVIIVHAYGGKDIINISPQPAAKPKITFIELLDVHKNTPKKAFAYGNWIIARVHCVGMELRPIVVTLWEDDGNGKKNTKIELKNRFIERGFVDARFYLNPAHADLANSKADKGESDEGQFHEYYITASIAGEKKSQISTENTTVANPLYLEKKLAVKNEISTDIQQQVINSLMMVDVSGDDPDGVWTKKEDTCVCKEYDLVWGNRVSCDFRKKVVEICEFLWPENPKNMANGLMAVINVETAGSFKAHQIMGKDLKAIDKLSKSDFDNEVWIKDKEGKIIKQSSSRAVGLIQFTQDALVAVGEFKNGNGFEKLHEVKLRFAKMGEVKQLDYVKKYFEKAKDSIITPEDIYLHVFAPSGVNKKDDFPLYTIGTEKYKQNKSVDVENNNDGVIQRSEILGRYKISYASGLGKKQKVYSGCKMDSKDTNLVNKNGWHNPVENPRRNKYNSKGNIKPVSGSYGDVREGYTKYHSGLDLFALPGTKVFSCMKGTIAGSSSSGSAGQIIRIKVDNVKDLLNQMEDINYSLEFDKGEIMGRDIKETDDVYLIYMHLSERYFLEGDVGTPVEAGTEIGLSGVSGTIASGIPSPHLHLEIATVKDAYGKGKTVRTNPARFIKLNSYDTTDQDDSVNFKYNQNGTKEKWDAPKENQLKL